MRKLKTLFALLVLSFFTIGNVWAETITLTYDDVSATSYSSSEQTFTNGVQFGYVYLMRNGTNGQPSGWAANQVMQVSKSSNNGLLYNKAPISRITNIRVYVVVNTNAFTLTYGNTTACDAGSISRPTTATGSESITYSSYADKKVTPGQSTTATYYDFDLSSSKPTYFKITNGSGVLYIWKVVITYTPEYAVSFSNPEHGSISVKNGVADVTSGDKFPANTTLTVTAAPTVENTYRETIKVIKTGVTPEADVTASVLSGSTLTMPAYPITISAEETQLFEIRTAVVVADEVGAQGNTATVNGESVVYVSEDDDLTLVATHAAGYEFVEWTMMTILLLLLQHQLALQQQLMQQ